MEEQTIPWDVMIHPDIEAIKKRDAFLSDENGEKLQEIVNSNFTKGAYCEGGQHERWFI